jgi:outer membrane protein assembly factor BamB
LWAVEGPATKTVSSIVIDEQLGLAFVCGGRDGNFYALRTSLAEHEQPAGPAPPNANANADSAFEPTPTLKQRLAWKSTKGIPYMTSPLVSKGRLHIFSDEGIYNCFEAKTGRVLKTVRAVGSVRASMIANDERIYLVEEDGTTTVFRNDDTWTVLAKNALSESVIASPAVAPGQLIIRGTKHLYAIH